MVSSQGGPTTERLGVTGLPQSPPAALRIRVSVLRRDGFTPFPPGDETKAEGAGQDADRDDRCRFGH